MGNNNKAPMMQPIPLAQPQGPQPPQNAQTMPGQTFGQPTGGVPGYAQPGQPKPKKPIWKQWWFWVIIVVVVVLDIAIIGGAGNSQGGGSAVDSSSAQSVAPKSTQKATPKKDAKLTGITASYSGSIKDGEQVTDKTSGITVTAKYDDGMTKNVTGWKIQNPGAVNINAPTEFTIEYEGQTAKVSIQAQPPVEYQNALNKAKSYSDMMHMSKQGIYDQLTSEYGGEVPRRSRAIRRGPPASRLQRQRVGQGQVLSGNDVHVLGCDLRPARFLSRGEVHPGGSTVRHRQSQQISKSPVDVGASAGRVKNPNPTREMERRTLRLPSYTGRSIPENAIWNYDRTGNPTRSWQSA